MLVLKQDNLSDYVDLYILWGHTFSKEAIDKILELESDNDGTVDIWYLDGYYMESEFSKEEAVEVTREYFTSCDYTGKDLEDIVNKYKEAMWLLPNGKLLEKYTLGD